MNKKRKITGKRIWKKFGNKNQLNKNTRNFMNNSYKNWKSNMNKTMKRK